MTASVLPEPKLVLNQTYRAYGAAERLLYYQGREVLLSGPAGTGKAQPLDAIIYTPSGVKQMGDIKLFDTVLTPSGQQANVIAIHPQGVKPIYRVTFTGGDSTECCIDHLWRVSYMGGGKRNGKRVREITTVTSTQQLLEGYLLGNRQRPKYYIPQTLPVEFNPVPVSMPPYLLGVLLGDGHVAKDGISFTSADQEIVDRVRQLVGDDYKITAYGSYGYTITSKINFGFQNNYSSGTRGVYKSPKSKKWLSSISIAGKQSHLGSFETIEKASQAYEEARKVSLGKDYRPQNYGLLSALRTLGLSGLGAANKFIPAQYKYNSVEVRLDILRGLMDTDGYVDRKQGQPVFTSVSQTLANDVKEVVESLGGICVIKEKQPYYPDANGEKRSGLIAYNCYIRYNDPANLFNLTRKRDIAKARTKYPVKRLIESIKLIGHKPAQCITLSSPEGLYLTNNFIVTHNSKGALEKLHLCAMKYAGMRGIILRKTRKSITQSAQVTYETKVLPAGTRGKGVSRLRTQEQEYRYRNGSIIAIGGLEDITRVMSSEWDMIYIQELIEVGEDEYEKCTTRLRNWVMPYQQLLADTNPDKPTHWILQRVALGHLKMFESRHEDNPELFSQETQEWTEKGIEYIATLDALSGARKERLRHGKWTSAEGLVYEDFDRSKHVVFNFKIPKDWNRYWVVDFGYTNPFVWQAWAEDHDGRLYRYKEIYRTQTLVEDHAVEIAKLTKDEPKPRAIICDHDAEGRATLERKLGITTVAADKSVVDGIQAVQSRLKVRGDGKPGILFLTDSLNIRDSELVAKHKPVCTEDEFDSYIWDIANNRKKGEEPVKEDDHSMDAMRYLVMHIDGKLRSKFKPAVGGTRTTLPPGTIANNPAPPIMPGMPNRAVQQPLRTPPGYRRVG
jgi:PBSX family phage terminase large subunit